MSERYPTGTDEERSAAVEAAALALQKGELAVIPTDTVYGIAADAFDKGAVTALLKAKGRGRDMPPPVLIGGTATLDALATRVPEWARTLVGEFWPGPLTVVFHQQPSLQWDLGDTRGTVAVRLPDHDIARDIIERVGPIAVSSANISGQPAATDADAAEEMLGDSVAAIVDAGPSSGGDASTIIDATHTTSVRVLRAGAVPIERLREILEPLDLTVEEPGEPGEPTG